MGELLKERMKMLSREERILAGEIEKLTGRYSFHELPNIYKIVDFFKNRHDAVPSSYFKRRGLVEIWRHRKLLDAFVPKDRQKSYLYIIDQLNQYPYSAGWCRRPVRTGGYARWIRTAFGIMAAYEKLFYSGIQLEHIILEKYEKSISDYIKECKSNFGGYFSYIYAAEIDMGNQAVIDAFTELILSENSTAYLDREMILGILRSDNEELHRLIGKLLLAARLQEGLRQAICETMDMGRPKAFLHLLSVIQDHDLLRFSSVKRAVATWIGIFNEKSVDRISGKLLEMMGRCLREPDYCKEQLLTEDSVGICVALWAKGFYEAVNAVNAINHLTDEGTMHQRLTASYYSQSLYDSDYKCQCAKKVMMEHMDDVELVTCYMPALTEAVQAHVDTLLDKKVIYGGTDYSQETEPKIPVVTDYFKDKEEAEIFYNKFIAFYEQMPKKGYCFEPFIFPWHRAELLPFTMVQELAFIACVLQDEGKITRMAKLIGEIPATVYYGSRSEFVNLLLYHPVNGEQREALIGYVGNTESVTASTAYRFVKRLTLRKEEYRMLEDQLRFKRSELRKQILDLLMTQKDSWLEESAARLISDKKEEKRTAGLDILLRISKAEDRTEVCDRVRNLPLTIKNPTDREKILIRELAGEKSQEEDPTAKKGFGFYDPLVDCPARLFSSEYGFFLPEIKEKPELIKCCLPLLECEIITVIRKLDDLIDQYKEYEYVSDRGEKTLLGNEYERLKSADGYGQHLEYYPLADVLGEFYKQEIKSYDVLLEMEVFLHRQISLYHKNEALYRAVFSKEPFKEAPFVLKYTRQVYQILSKYRGDFLDKQRFFEMSVQVITMLTGILDSKSFPNHYKRWDGSDVEEKAYVHNLPLFVSFFQGLTNWQTDEEFQMAFTTAYRFEMKFKSEDETGQFLIDGNQTATPIELSWFVKAYLMKLVPKDLLYKAVFEYMYGGKSIKILSEFMSGAREKEDHTAEGEVYRELYNTIIPAMTDVELRRGDGDTVFTKYILAISYISGIPYLVRILAALGKDTLERSGGHYYFDGRGFSTTKKQVLCSLLEACYPADKENGNDLRALLRESDIKDSRLIEVAMYTPQWIDLIEEYLGLNGFKSGCYYFMAHMNEYFDDKRKAMIAKYTPISTEDLRDGAFDALWFKQAYGLLGETHFGELYQAAKYISSGSSHSRARKYADAASGKVGRTELKREIGEKRNKDLLMSYGLIPLEDNKTEDMLERYQYIQQFIKESKQFGSLRRASETKAGEMALLNLSVNAGFSNLTRLTLNMETQMAIQFSGFMEWKTVGDVEIKISVGEDGKSSILCRKEEKLLKSVPSKIKKDAYVLEIKAVNKTMKDQFSRARRMMEDAMEDETEFTAGEIARLYENPVVRPIMESLVYLCGGSLGLFRCGQPSCSLIGRGEVKVLEEDSVLKIAHPVDFYHSGVWHEYQKDLFERKLRQPFKQVYRELYVKLSEEMGQEHSLMFAGNQIQPQKTVACLKGRGWIADHEDGLQKIYYKADIIARIYALADWFSPSDIEAPTLEWVEFYDRRSFKALTMEQIPDVIYSEVMRDVDLAVSVAHAGGVDPECSHSTIEMRRAIIEFNLPLFGLNNVSLKESHAIIHGTRGEYNVHLGSGVVHQTGGAMLPIIPVHSQSRGKLFLPFVDEDPKTAEIMSKIVLLAEDKKIKDPFILDQIR